MLSAAVEWADERSGVGDFQRLQMTFHRGRAMPMALAALVTSNCPPLWRRTYSKNALKRFTSRKPNSC